MKFDFSGYKIHIPKEGSAGTLLEPSRKIQFLDESEILPYNEGIEIILKEKRGLWLSKDLEYDQDAILYFQSLGIIV